MKFDHVAFNVEDISGAVKWYVNEYGASVVYQDETWGMVLINDTKIAFTLPGHHPTHIGFCVEDISDFPDEAEIKKHRDESMYFYKSDPWGNTIEIIKY